MKKKGFFFRKVKTTDEKIKEAYNYAANFYSNNHRGLDNQEKCLAEMQKISGLDRETCIKIQNPIMDVFMMSELMEIGNTIAQQHLDIVTNNIRQHLLNIQPTLESCVLKELPSIPIVPKLQPINSVETTTNEIMPEVGHYKNVDFSNKNLGFKGIEYLLYGGNNIPNLSGAKKDGVLAKSWIVNLNLSNCNLDGLSSQYIASAIHNGNLSSLNYLNLSNNSIDDAGIYEFASRAPTAPSPSLRSLNLSNNKITDNGANSFYWALKQNKMFYLKYIDLSENSITDQGKADIAKALKVRRPDTIVTLEKHNDSTGVLNFIKKAFNYYSEETNKKLQENDKAVLAIYGQNNWVHCKKLIQDTSKNMQVGIATYSSNYIAKQFLEKAPSKIKSATKGAIFIAASTEAALNIDVEDLLYCIATVNMKVKDFVFGKDMMLPENTVGFLGEDGTGEYVDF